ncbi:MAG: sodium:dicarboxylate symporter [Phycisphaerales bacterium]|nr:sodium:dicarboxylate symporter [Phycisphaerales bacterium]
MSDVIPQPATGPFARWQRLPLYLRILIGLILGIIAGAIMGQMTGPGVQKALGAINVPALLVLRLLNALATPLIFLAVVRALLTADVEGRDGRKLVWLLFTNTLVAVLIGLLVANVLQPGRHSHAPAAPTTAPAAVGGDPIAKLLENVPGSLLKPLVDGNPVSAIIIALGVGFAFRALPAYRKGAATVAAAGFDAIVVMLHWVIALVPLAIFCKVTNLVGLEGFAKFANLGWFVAAVLVALALQTCFYLTRLRLGSWVRPLYLLHGMRDALVMAFSTASSTASTPVTYACLTEKVKIREKSADLGAMIGSNFNNDGTALYEAMCALFVAQLIGMDLSIPQQVLVVLTSVIAGTGAAGIPEAGLVTMTLVFNAVGLPVTMIPLLLTVDWFLDRCRTMINVLSDSIVSCLVDGKERPGEQTDPEPETSTATPQPA